VKVALFTSYSPDIGGGAVNLRTLLAGLTEYDVTWFHLGGSTGEPKPGVWLGPRLIGGSLASDLVGMPALWLGARQRALDRLADRVLALGAERHWVLAMDEGIPLGLRLAQRAPHISLHVSIQDDQERGMYGRSRRYRALSRLVRKPFRQLLRITRSIDVTSEGMKEYYAQTLGVHSTVVHPVIAGRAPHSATREVSRDPRRLTLGHIGAVYSASEFKTMLAALKRAAGALGREPAVVLIGLLPRLRDLVQQAGIVAELPAHLPEPEAILALARCDFVYAMYPFDRASETFVRTSLPTKLTTYVQAGRPILAHAPKLSTLAATIDAFRLGAICESDEITALERAMSALATATVLPERFEDLREDYYGTHNVTRLSALLRDGTAA
jgi:hypothetical protein